jgi:osmoprotectant transport system permease protein
VSFYEYLADSRRRLFIEACGHVGAVLVCTLLAAVLGVLIGLVASRSERAGDLVTAATGAFLTVPTLALVGLLIPVTGLGLAPTLAALTLCGLLPIVRNSLVALRPGDPSLVDAARGIGMSRWARFARVELPLAWPSILTGIRASTRLLVGVAAVAAYASGPGLGNEIFRGLGSPDSENALNEVLAGTLGIFALSVLFDAAYLLLERLTVPRRIARPVQPEERTT